MKTPTQLIKVILLIATSLVSIISVNANATTPNDEDSNAISQTIVEENTKVILSTEQFDLPGTTAHTQWVQTQGRQVTLDTSNSDVTTYTTPPYLDNTDNNLTFVLVVTDVDNILTSHTSTHHIIPAQSEGSPELIAQRNQNEFLIPGEYHPLGNELIAVINFPQGASAQNPVPGCAIIHGSGGLFKENDPGQHCSQDIENNYQAINDLLNSKGIATILPSSFYSREPRFCEDNDSDYLAFASAPFFNGNDVVSRNTSYKIRRMAVRTMDMLATMRFFCDLDQVDCSNACMVGTSNGASSIMAYSAQSIAQDLPAFMDDAKRPFEYNSDQTKRNDAFENFPELTVSPITLNYQLTHRPTPNFAQLISPGCTMRDIVPDIEPGNENLPFGLNELYYPQAGTELTFEIGTADDTPDECYNNGFREVQARYFEQESGIAPMDSRYILEIHQDGIHNLLDDEGPHSSTILQRLSDLADSHL